MGPKHLRHGDASLAGWRIAADGFHGHSRETPDGYRLGLAQALHTVRGFGRGLTSYNFNIAAIVNALLEHILAPKRTRPSRHIIELPGMVLERKTSGSPNEEVRL